MKKSLYSTTEMSKKLIEEIEKTLEGLKYGSVELYVQNGEVTQITRRDIRKTK